MSWSRGVTPEELDGLQPHITRWGLLMYFTLLRNLKNFEKFDSIEGLCK